MANVSTVTTGFFPTAKEGFATTLSATAVSGATVVSLNSVVGYENGDHVVLVVDPGDASKKQVFTGTVDATGLQLTGVKWTEGTNQDHLSGAVVVDYETATHWALYSKGLKVAHNPDGTIKAAVTTSIANEVLNTGKNATNLRVKPRTLEQTSVATLAPNIDNYSVYRLSAQAEALTVGAPTGTPNPNDVILILIKDNGTTRTVTWNAAFTNISGVDSLTATVAGKWHAIGAVYDTTTAKWQILSITTSA